MSRKLTMRRSRRYIQTCGSLLSLALLLGLVSPAGAETLQQAWQAALKDNHGYRASHLDQAYAEEQLAAAKALRLPSLDAAGGLLKLEQEQQLSAGLLGQQFNIPMAEENSYSYSVMARLPLYSGGQISHGIAAAAAVRDLYGNQREIDAERLKREVAGAYVAVLKSETMLTLAKSHAATLKAHAYDVEGLFQTGMVMVSDKLSVEVALADARQQVFQAQKGVALARATYNQLLGRPLDEEQRLEQISLPPLTEELSLAQLTERALQQRHELQLMDDQARALTLQGQAVTDGGKPQLAIAAGYNYQQNRYLVHEGQWLAMVQLQWNLFDGGRRAHQAGALDRQAESIRTRQREAREQIALMVHKFWLEVEEAQKRSHVASAAVVLAEQNLNVVRDRYRNGFSIHSEVLDAETLRLNSETNASNARYDVILAQLDLQYALGEL